MFFSIILPPFSSSLIAKDNIVLVTGLQKYIKQLIFNYKGDNSLSGTSKNG